MKGKAELPLLTQARRRRALELPSKGTPSDVRTAFAFMVWHLCGQAGVERKILRFSATVLNANKKWEIEGKHHGALSWASVRREVSTASR
jgi:hypothetical protein